MARQVKITEERARAALALLEMDTRIQQEHVAELFGVSRTTLRRGLQRLADKYGDQEEGLRERVATVRTRISQKRIRRSSLSPAQVAQAKEFLDKVPELTRDDVARFFGVSRATLYRSFERYDQSSPCAPDTLVGRAQIYIPAAAMALRRLYIPNDLPEDHRDLFVELVSEIERLEVTIASLTEASRPTKGHDSELPKYIERSLPLWKRAWETFVLKSAEGVGLSAGHGAVFSAGFVAGALYMEFSQTTPGVAV